MVLMAGEFDFENTPRKLPENEKKSRKLFEIISHLDS